MSSINLHTEEICIKIVFYGPGLGGKTTSLQYIHKALLPSNRGQLISLATGIDRTLYFDFLPIKLPKLRGYTVRMSLYTVPGQVHYNATRKLVLQGADGVVFVADSQTSRHDANVESMENLDANLRAQGMQLEKTPLVILYNKRDLSGVLPVETMDTDLNPRDVPAYESCAISGDGVVEALKTITKLVLADLKRKGIYEQEREQERPSVIEQGFDTDGADEGIAIIAEADPYPDSENSQLAQAVVTHLDSQPPPPSEEEEAEPLLGDLEGLALSVLWESDGSKRRVRTIEQEILDGRFTDAVRLAEDLLADHVADLSGMGLTTAEGLLALGVNGAHYVRFQNAVAKGEATRKDALFCLFFLTDIELRMQATRARILA